MWDAGVVIGYVVYIGEQFKDVMLKIDPLAINCDRFVHNKAVNCENYISSNGYSEVDSRFKKNYATFSALITMIKTGKFNPNPLIDIERLLSLQKKFSLDKVEALKGLIQIQSVIQGRFIQVYKLCKMQRYSKRIERINENKIESKFRKRGDLLNFSCAIHFHNHKCECTFITTDKNDFAGLDLSGTDLPYKIPDIEYVQDY